MSSKYYCDICKKEAPKFTSSESLFIVTKGTTLDLCVNCEKSFKNLLKKLKKEKE